MARYFATALCLAMTLALTACGGGNVAPPAGGNTGGGSGGGNKPAPANTPEEGPREDPDLWKKVKSALPAGWHAVKGNSPVQKELERHVKPIPKDWKFVSGVVNSKAPGPTEPDEAWGEWEKQAAGALLYFVSKEQKPAKAAAAELGKQVAAGEGSGEGNDSLGWIELQGGEVPVFAISNKLGTYVVVGVVLTSDTEAAGTAIRQWAESVKPE
ncbi:MAG: hypothetical protein H6841_05775 [Planctomycetes bacterium]|nr:hypothetical protein [Planctomycetota bacterium]MCB9934336.1 hypothetical protein [Planctomycetota bacterium]